MQNLVKGESEVKYCGVWMAEREKNDVVDLAAVTIMIPDKCGRRLETVRVGECVLTQPAITITIPDEMLVASALVRSKQCMQNSMAKVRKPPVGCSGHPGFACKPCH